MSEVITRRPPALSSENLDETPHKGFSDLTSFAAAMKETDAELRAPFPLMS